jgi:hypothetical protein
MPVFRRLAIALVVCTLTGCALGPQAVIQPTATLLPSLRSLPAKGKVPCRFSNGIAIWELPASFPPDPDSGGPGLKGEVLGTLYGCTAFAVTKVAWSIYDQEYYVYVETSGVKGWVALEIVEVIP